MVKQTEKETTKKNKLTPSNPTIDFHREMFQPESSSLQVPYAPLPPHTHPRRRLQILLLLSLFNPSLILPLPPHTLLLVNSLPRPTRDHMVTISLRFILIFKTDRKQKHREKIVMEREPRS